MIWKEEEGDKIEGKKGKEKWRESGKFGAYKYKKQWSEDIKCEGSLADISSWCQQSVVKIPLVEVINIWQQL